MEKIRTLLGNFIGDNLFKEYHTGEVFKVLIPSPHTPPTDTYIFIKTHEEYDMLVLDDYIIFI